MMAATVTHFVVAAGLIPASGWPTPLATLALKQKLAEDQARLKNGVSSFFDRLTRTATAMRHQLQSQS